jgi:hypothetical protein
MAGGCAGQPVAHHHCLCADPRRHYGIQRGRSTLRIPKPRGVLRRPFHLPDAGLAVLRIYVSKTASLVANALDVGGRWSLDSGMAGGGGTRNQRAVAVADCRNGRFCLSALPAPVLAARRTSAAAAELESVGVR